MVASHARPAEVIRDPSGLEPPGEGLEAIEVGFVERIGRSDRQRHAVQHDRVALPHAGQHVERPPARDHEVLGDRLEPVDAGRPGEDPLEVIAPQADAVAEEGGPAAGGGPRNQILLHGGGSEAPGRRHDPGASVLVEPSDAT